MTIFTFIASAFYTSPAISFAFVNKKENSNEWKLKISKNSGEGSAY